MKRFNQIIGTIGLACLAMLAPTSARAAGEIDYQAHTIYTVPSAFPTGTASNIAAQVTTEIVNCTKHDQFTFALFTTPNATGAQGNVALGVRWSVSADGVNWPATAIDVAGQTGHFTIPLTNNTGQITWQTNITMNTLGYWRLDYLTNNHSGSLTNGHIKAWFKPQRNGNTD